MSLSNVKMTLLPGKSIGPFVFDEELTPELAEQLVYTIDCLSEENRTKFIEALLESEDGFISMVEFANGVE